MISFLLRNSFLTSVGPIVPSGGRVYPSQTMLPSTIPNWRRKSCGVNGTPTLYSALSSSLAFVLIATLVSASRFGSSWMGGEGLDVGIRTLVVRCCASFSIEDTSDVVFSITLVPCCAAILLRLLFHRCLMASSVRPGITLPISCHLLPNFACITITNESSSSVHSPLTCVSLISCSRNTT